jgi:NAD(P)-dependent dehydrogenase (short-subunit alcohol dehydrogenase family)
MDWSTADIPDQTGRVFVVTGANSGIGFETAKALTDKGAYVVLACRDVAKGEQARAGLTGRAEVRHLDLADLASVRAFADGLADWRIETLVNNAGIMNVPFVRTAQGVESQFATNVLGHFLLTALLLPRLTDRVVWLASGAHRMGAIRLDDLGFERRKYNGWVAYGQSKLADLVLAYELQRRLTAAGSLLRSMAAHPGYAATNLQQRSGTWQDTLGGWLNSLPFLVQSAADGALPTLYAATIPDLPGGTYVGPGGFGEMRGAPRPVGSSAASHDRETAAALWARCEELSGQSFAVTA